ncbi:MAG TPA: F0F1 ATP synthase subunit A [Candidatus Dormibacteraeota bacterium]|nr:F0F1 ATP synthase subunit A [Candidatus Dormibacteraeota bacterium]
MIFLAESVGQPAVNLGCGPLNLFGFQFPICTFNYDSLISTFIAVVATLAVGFWIRSQLRPGQPTKVQAIVEWGYDLLRSLIKTNVSEDALFIIPLAMTLFLYILVANWIEFLPLGIVPDVHGANADLNQTLAMAVIVIVVVEWYSIRVLGLGGFLRRFTKPFELPAPVRAVFIPLNIIEEVTKPVTLAFRLFGNIFAGAAIIGLIVGFANLSLPAVGTVPGTIIGSVLLAVWKAFDVLFIGFIQAFIFMLLTIVYFSAAREGLEHEQH